MSIKMTLYRMARDSQIVQALMQCSRKRQGSVRHGGAARPL